MSDELVSFHTASGRLYEFDTTELKYRRIGDQDLIDYRQSFEGSTLAGDGGLWHDYLSAYLRDDARLMILEDDGTYSVTTRVIDEDLEPVLSWLDGGA